MILAANVLNAVGGRPQITGDWVPRYPAAIPYHEPESFQVGLLAFGDEALDAFLAIENPSYPVSSPTPAAPHAAIPRATQLARERGYATIGAFYAAIEDGLRTLNAELGPDKLFTGPATRQIAPEHYYASGGSAIIVHDLDSALLALEEIVEQGEGALTQPPSGEKFDATKDLAHFYRFNELRRRRRYLADDLPATPTGAAIELDLDAVYPMKPNLRVADLPTAELREVATACNVIYARLLDQLQTALDGRPAALTRAVGTMFELKYAATELLRTPLADGSGLHAGPTFEHPPHGAARSTTRAARQLQPPPIDPAYDGSPFYYASLAVLEVLYLVDVDTLRPYLAGSGLEVATFEDGRAAAGFNFQMYTSMFPGSMGTIMEIELNAFAYPSGAHQPMLSFHDWVTGADESRLIGSHRVHVPCDDDVAIAAGMKLYGEPKFKTQFLADFPLPNGPGGTAWSFVCCDPAHPPAGDDADARAHAIYTCSAQLAGLGAVLSDPSPVTVYGAVTVDGPTKGRPVGARWNILRPFETYFLGPGDGARVLLGYGASNHPMQADVRRMVGDAPAVVVRTTVSPPAAIQSRTYWP